MKTWHLNIILTLFSLLSYNAFSQTNCTVPLPPLFTLVSVQPETGNTEFSWTSSPSSDIAAYIIYSYKNGDGLAIDTLWDPLATSYTIPTTASKYYSVSYVIASYRLPVIPGMDGCPSPLSNVLNTIFAKADIDSCNKKLVISWNGYQSLPDRVIDYSILMSVHGGNFTEVAKTDPGSNNYTLNDFTTDEEYCFVIRANLEGGNFSTSNKACLLTKMQRPPLWINADQATVNADNKISLSFSVDPLSEITHFNLERKTGTSGTFQKIAQPVSVDGSVHFIDDQADISNVNYYRLSAINNCNNPVTVSNLCSNIVLSLERTGKDLKLSWNPYKEWLGMVSLYRLFINTGNGFAEKVELQPSDTVLTLGYQDIMYEVTGNEVCFYISALETSNPYGVTGQSQSSGVCTGPTEIITVPNVFTPNNDMINDFFKPVLSFTPLDYHLVISDRQGKILFETRDYNATWDGSQKGKPYPTDVCLWFLKVTTPSGKSISKTGTLTIINNR
jgi:gliding motility-associated-like protein